MDILATWDFYISQRMNQTSAAVLTLAEVLNDTSEQGQLTLSQGTHTVQIFTDETPSTVFLSLEPDSAQVCGAGLDTAGATISPDGFTVFATIQSNSCLVNWLVM